MTNEERVLKAVRHLEECLAHLDNLADEADLSDETVRNILSGTREELRERLDHLGELGSIFAQEGR